METNQTALYNSYLSVNMNKISNNYKTAAAQLPNGVCCIPVLKGNAYGHGLVPVAKALCGAGANVLAVAQVREGVQLRQSGISQPEILVLGGVPQQLFPAAVTMNIGISLFHGPTAQLLDAECEKQGVNDFPVHIKIETGLHRIGVTPGAELAALVKALQSCTHLHIAGVFSHFADGEAYHSELAQRQYRLFQKAVAQLADAGIHPPLVHICNSGASEWFAEAVCTGVRLGRRLYMDSQQHPGAAGAIEPVSSWRASITNLRWLEPGDCIGYDGAWVAARRTRVAVVCVGYGDGLFPPLADAHAPVLVGEQRAPLLGTCMDQCFVDVTELSCAVGDEVTFFGESSNGTPLLAQEVAALVGDEGVYLTSLLTDRVARVYQPQL